MNCKNKNGWTLVELLVVISIIAALLAVLMPAMNRAREQAKSIVCRSNLRQMSIAAVNYAAVNNDYYPLAYYSKKIGSIRYNYSWDFTLCRDWNSSPAAETIEPGILWQKITIEQVQQCPSFKNYINTDGRPYNGYNYNTSHIGMDETQWPFNSVKITRVKKPSDTAIFGDGLFSGGANNYMRAPLQVSFSGNYAGTQGYRHLDKTNVSYCDGSSRSVKERFIETDSAGKRILEEYNRTAKVKIGFLSPDNSVYDLE